MKRLSKYLFTGFLGFQILNSLAFGDVLSNSSSSGSSSGSSSRSSSASANSISSGTLKGTSTGNSPKNISTECYNLEELNNFKDVYIKLQQELNYEGTDAFLDKNFKLQVKPHDPNTPYGGKVFEQALFAEYQNSLRKIGKLYQSAKFSNDESFKTNESLVSFIKSIDNSDSTFNSDEYIKQAKVQDVLKTLQEASVKKYANDKDKKYVINDNDKYLLEKLLTHSQDRICSVNAFIKTNKGTMYFKPDYLQQVKNAPLNRLIRSIREASISKDSDIDSTLVDSNVAMKSAITDHLNDLGNWIKKVKTRGDQCMAKIKSQAFLDSIQSDMQICNFGHFMDSLSKDNADNLESVLHFINANEKFLTKRQAKAETALDEVALEGFIGDTFKNLGLKINCSKIDDPTSKTKKVFVSNLPYDKKSNTFDQSNIICKLNNQEMPANACISEYSLVSDSLGRGLEIQPKKGSSSKVTFSVKDNPDCSDIGFSEAPEETIESTKASTPQPLTCNETPKPGFKIVPNEQDQKCDEVSLCTEKQTWDVNAAACVELPAETKISEGEEECLERNREWKEKYNNGLPGTKWKWDRKNADCKNMRPSPEDDGEVSGEEEVAPLEFPSKTPPMDFAPINIPTKQMQLYRGMV